MTDIINLSALDISDRIASGGLTCVEVMTAFLDRIEKVNPQINAIVSLRPRADLLAEAQQADETPRKGWLHGLPIAIKDLAETSGIRTTMGSPLFAEYVPATDALLVERIKNAGAIVIGKTNTPEFGLGSHTTNPVHGPTRNPYDLTRSAGGSSGGAAAALAARMVPIADGSDMMGSLRNPAAFCNVYGYRPSWGVVPNEPSGELFLQQLATSGPMGRSPADIAALLNTLSGADARLPHTPPTHADFNDLTQPVTGKRIAWLRDWGGEYPSEEGVLDQCETAMATFNDLGCTVETIPAPFNAKAIWSSWVTLRAWANACRMKDAYADPAKRSLLNDAMIWEIELGLSLSAADIHDASVIRSNWFRTVVELQKDYDAFALPSAQVWPFPVDWTHPKTINGTDMDTYHRWMEVVVPVSLIGLPALAIPAGFGANDLPMGIQVFGGRGQDQDILTLGQAYHDQRNWTEQQPKTKG